jgi:hypothetical protein
MEGFIVISSKALEQHDLLDLYKDIGKVDVISPDRLIVDGEWGHFFVTANNALIYEFDDEEIAKLNKECAHNYFYAIEFSTSIAANNAIKNLPLDVDLVIDNDHGLIAPIKTILARIDAGSDWTNASF